MLDTYKPYCPHAQWDRLNATPDYVFLMGLIAGQRPFGNYAVEIGTYEGVTTSNIARLLPDHHVLTVSLPPDATPALAYHPGDMALNKVPTIFDPTVKDRITHLLEDSSKLELPADAKVGFAFIDGSHTYDYVMNDFELIYANVIRNSLIVFHDYDSGHPEVVKAVNDLAFCSVHHWGSYGNMAWCRVTI